MWGSSARKSPTPERTSAQHTTIELHVHDGSDDRDDLSLGSLVVSSQSTSYRWNEQQQKVLSPN
jgi:hypothetical protein